MRLSAASQRTTVKIKPHRSDLPVEGVWMYVLIPADYEAQGVVPIGISDVDYKGRLVMPGWIEAVKPVAGSLRRITELIYRRRSKRITVGRRDCSLLVGLQRRKAGEESQLQDLCGREVASAQSQGRGIEETQAN